jgi:hypothetical protein
MQAKPLVLSILLAVAWTLPLAAGGRDWGRGDGGGDGDGRRHGRPDILIEPNIDLSRPRPNPDAPEFVMAEVRGCAQAGIRSFVDCLRANHSSVMIRRLEACVNSETIPDDPQRVLACLPPVPVQ